MFFPDMVDTFVAEINTVIAVQKGAAMPPCTGVSAQGPKGDGWRRFLSGLFLRPPVQPQAVCSKNEGMLLLLFKQSGCLAQYETRYFPAPPGTRGVGLSEHGMPHFVFMAL